MIINIKKIEKRVDDFKLDIAKIVEHLKKQLKNHQVNHEKLKPEIVWKYFVEICKIPHVSHNEKPITNYLMKTFQDLGYKPILDKSFNVIVYKSASKGYEHAPIIALQAHSDMVGSKGKNSQHNFDRDPIKMIQKGDLIYANDTTLGADDGIGVAIILAIFADKSLKHGPIEGIITANEETGMFGIQGLDYKQLKSKYLINLDSENDGEIIIGCPGSLDIDTSFPFKREPKLKDSTNLRIELTNARGGHSGQVINQKRINAIRCTFFLLTFIMDKYDIRLIHFEPAGTAKNVIPSECVVHINVKTIDIVKIKELVKIWTAEVKKEYRDEKHFATLVSSSSEIMKPMSKRDSYNIVAAYAGVPNGINTLTDDLNNPETSLSLGKLWEEKKSIHTLHMIRSPYDYAQYRLANRIKFMLRAMGGTAKEISFMKGWLPKPSKFIDHYVDTYKKVCHRNIVKTVATGGLELAFLLIHRPDIHMFSIGPNMYEVHSPKEHVSIASVARLYKTLVKFLSIQ